MRTWMLVLVLGAFGATLWHPGGDQSGRTDPRKSEEERPQSPPLKSAPSVLALMKREEWAACGLAKLSEEELDRLDRWILQLLLTMSATPSGELRLRSPAEELSQDLRLQQMERELSDLRYRLLEIRHASAQLALDLSRARLAAERRDPLGVTTFLFSAESSAARIHRTAQ